MGSSSNQINNNSIKPFLKWAGGKRWFVSQYDRFIPKKYNRYLEPFLGSGAVFFHLRPRDAILGDCNKDLIATYTALNKNWELVYRYLKNHQKNHSKEYYYQIRNANIRSEASQAARFIYLNRTCWNGLYRVNKKGLFNVPIGTRSTVLLESDNFNEISKLLDFAKLYNSDFEIIIDKAKQDDLLFIDPPYTVRHNHNAFIKYNEILFSWQDQIRLFKSLKKASDRGAIIVATNAYHDCIMKLYKNDFLISQLSRSSGISSDKTTRGRFEELLILSS